MTNINQKTWLVTGAARGLGAAIAGAALDAGDRVVVAGRDREALVRAFGADSDTVLSVAIDVTDPVAIAAGVDAAVARFGRIDILVNNAGYGHLGVFEELTAQDARAQFDTNVFGLFDVTRAVLPIMRAQRSGHVFNISSGGGMVGGASGSIYCATKFAVEGFSESIAQELSPSTFASPSSSLASSAPIFWTPPRSAMAATPSPTMPRPQPPFAVSSMREATIRRAIPQNWVWPW